MREIKLASFVLMGALAVFACTDDGPGDDTGTGGGTATGGGTGSGGGTATGGGGGAGPVPEGCGKVITLTSADALIDDFNHGDSPAIPDENGDPKGEWAHGSNLSPTGGGLLTFPQEAGGFGGGPSLLHAECVQGDTDNSPQCNQAWDEDAPWSQWAAVSTLLSPWAETLNCVDVTSAGFTGIKFKAKSNSSGGDKIRIQLATPDADTDAGATFNSPELTLGASMEEFQVPFSSIEQPSWYPDKVPLNLGALQSISFAVRSVTEQSSGDITGETLNPYDIQIDDVSFY